MIIDGCPHCNAATIIRNIMMSQGTEPGRLGLDYKALKFFAGGETLLADLCTSCGTVVRFHVKNTDRKWMTRD